MFSLIPRLPLFRLCGLKRGLTMGNVRRENIKFLSLFSKSRESQMIERDNCLDRSMNLNNVKLVIDNKSIRLGESQSD